MFRKVLVANRGEIAVRVIRACRELSIPTVAVYSTADRLGLPVQMADEAVCLGPPAPRESYLNIEAIVEAARKSGAEAVHPGYGFLAENHRFAARCVEAGLVFIGPPAEAIRLMGDKVESRARMKKAGVPIIPGSTVAPGDAEQFLAEAERIGYPVLIKAAAGGGGKGMRVVPSPGQLRQALESARREAGSAFGDATVYLERFLERPRHVEFQVLADSHGQALHLFERECSIQRRHQKIVEETPSPALTPALRREMGEAAVQAARAAGYTNAGTVEFLLDSQGRFYFLEMNTRIQVEHPVTEFVTGVDLVRWQLRIAAGERLSLRQEELRQTGHALECRIYAEDPAKNFMPCPGTVLFAREPSGPGVRNDSSIFSGLEVTPDYDPILSKLITWGVDREHARRRMIAALREMVVLGIPTTAPFLADLLELPAFAAGETFTDFIATHLSGWGQEEGAAGEPVPLPWAVLAAAGLDAAHPVADGRQRSGADRGTQAWDSPWARVGPWQVGSRIARREG